MTKPTPSTNLWRVVMGINLILVVLAMGQIQHFAIEMGFSLTRIKWLLLIAAVVLIALANATGLILTFTKLREKVVAILEFPKQATGYWALAVLLLLAISLSAFSLISFHSYLGQIIQGRIWMRMLTIWWLSLAGAYGLKMLKKQLTWPQALGTILLMQGLVFNLVLLFSQISNCPFVLGWSESNRYYDASLFFAKRIYGISLPPPIMEPALHLLLAVPFIFGDFPIWIHLAWQVVLTIGLTAAIGVVLAQRVAITNRLTKWLFVAFVFLFLQQAATYAHLLLTVLIVLCGVKPLKYWRSLLVVVIVSIWAGLTRFNWFPIPGILASILYFLEVPVERNRRGVFHYLLTPLSWFFAGTLAAIASQYAYILWSGNGNIDAYFTNLSSTFLWYRLFPNATFVYGILPGTLLVSAPLLLILSAGIWGRLRNWHPIRLMGLGAILIVLFAGGLVSSTKIGGGGDLHNMDAYIITLLLIGTYMFFSQFIPENSLTAITIPWAMIGFAVIVPFWFAIQAGGPYQTCNPTETKQALTEIQRRSSQVTRAGQEVLFLSQRHLLAFKTIQDVPLVPDYEKDIMVEMIFSNNRTYMEHFYLDVVSYRFGLIIADPQVVVSKGRNYLFGEENDAWVHKVTIPLLCYYEPVFTSYSLKVEVLAPRAKPCQ
jgi:hypothetical protein